MSQQSFIISDGLDDVAVKNTNPIGTEVGLITRVIDPAEGATGASTPTTAVLLGASDGADLQPLLVESSSNKNLRTSIFQGANEAIVLNSTPVGTEYALAVRIIGASAGGTSSLFTQPFPSAGTAAGFTDGYNMQGATVFDLDSGAGEQYVLGTNLRFTSSGGSVEAGTFSDPLRIDPTGTTIQPVSGTITADQGGVWTVQQGSAPWSFVGTKINNDTAPGTTNVGTLPALANTAAPSWTDGYQVALSVDLSGGLRVATHAVTQSGTWTVQPGNTQNTTPWLTQDSADGPVSPGSVASKSILIGGQYNASLPTLADTQQAAMQVDSNGRLLISSIANALPTGSNVIGAVTQSAGPWTQNITQFGGNAVVTGTGASGVGIPRVTVANDSNILATQSGTWTVQQGTPPWTFVGNKTNNNATPGATNIGTLPAVANTVAPSWTDGYQVALSVDLVGNLRSNIASWFGSTAPTVGQKTMANSIPVTIASDQSKVPVHGTTADGYTAVNPPVTVGGVDDAGNVQNFHTDSSGNLQVVLNTVSASATVGLVQGLIALGGGTAGTLNSVRATTYTEQTTAAQRSIKSANINDTSAGTGAQQVTLTYFDASLNGPFTEIITMNGTTTVVTTATDICFIENIIVTRSGSSGTNAGIISFYVNTAGTGTVIGSIGVGNLTAGFGDGKTLWAHHYVPTGKTASLATVVTGLSVGTGSTNGTSFLKVQNVLTAGSTDRVIGDLIGLGTGNAVVRQLGVPLRITGPARVTGYGIPSSNNCTITFSFDFSELPT